MANNIINILLVEDDDVDVLGITRALKKYMNQYKLFRAVDGIEALNMLRGENGYPLLAKPYLILLDINMPRMDGFDFLKEIRKDQILNTTVVFVLTTSCNENDKLDAYKLNIAGYIIKSELNNGFVNVIEMLRNYCQVVRLP